MTDTVSIPVLVAPASMVEYITFYGDHISKVEIPPANISGTFSQVIEVWITPFYTDVEFSAVWSSKLIIMSQIFATMYPLA